MPNRSNLNRGNDVLIPGKAVNELGGVQPLLCDTATQRMLVTITSDAGAATGVTGNARIDQNNVSTILALAYPLAYHLDGTPVLIPLARDADGNLLADVLFT